MVETRHTGTLRVDEDRFDGEGPRTKRSQIQSRLLGSGATLKMATFISLHLRVIMYARRNTFG